MTTQQQERNKQIVRRFITGYQEGLDERVLEECVAPGLVDHLDAAGTPVGREGVRKAMEGFHAAMPDFRVEIREMVAEGDKVVTHKVLRGTHRGDLNGIPATGRELAIEVIDILRIEDGRMAEHWAVVDRAGLLQQVGALPEPALAAQQ